MPVTDHEKQLRVHSRSSTDLLAAVPIKKRRFLFTRSPSPPPESPSRTPADCGISGNKPKSPEREAACSKAETTCVQVKIVKDKIVSCESRDLQSQKPADFGIPEKCPEPSDLWSSFSINAGNNHVNSVTGQLVSSESSWSQSETPAECCVSEKKPKSSEPASTVSTLQGNPVLVNAVTGGNASTLSLPPPAGCGLSEKEPDYAEQSPVPASGVSHAWAGGEHCEFPYSTPARSGTFKRKPEASNMQSPFLEAGRNSSQMKLTTGKDASNVSFEVPLTRGLNVCPKSEILSTFNDSGLSLGTSYLNGTGSLQGSVFNINWATTLVSASMATPLEANKESVVTGQEGNMEGKFFPREGTSVKQEVSELQNLQNISSDTKLKPDSSHLCLNRSSWDLNTTMDAWEGTSIVSTLNNTGAADYGRHGLGDIPNKRVELCLKQILTEEPNGTHVTPENHLLQKDNHHHKLPNQYTSIVNSHLDASLDLKLKPFSLPDLSNLPGKHDSSRELPFLTLGTKTALSTSNPPPSTARSVKSEPIENSQKDAGEVKLGVLNSSDLNSSDLRRVKSEPCEGQKLSKASSPGVTPSRAIKQEPLEDQSRGYVRSAEGSSFPMGPTYHGLQLQGKPMRENAGADNSKVLDASYKSLALKSCMNRPGLTDETQVLENEDSVPGNASFNSNIPNDSSDVAGKAQGLFYQASVPGNDLSIGSTVTLGSKEIATELPTLVSKSPISDGSDLSLHPEAYEKSSLSETLLPESSSSSGDGHVSKSPSELTNKEDALNGHPSFSLSDGFIGKDCENSEVVKSYEFENKAAVSSEVVEKHDNTCKSDSSHVVSGAINTVGKQCGKDDEDIEDGEVRHPTSNGTVEASSGVTEEHEVKAADSVCSVNLSVSPQLLVDEKETKVTTSKAGEAFTSRESDGIGILDNKVEQSASPASVVTADSLKKSTSKTIRRNPKDHSKNNKGIESKSKSSDIGGKTSPPIAASNEQRNGEGPSSVMKYLSSQSEPSKKEGAKKNASDNNCNRRIIYLNSASSSLASEKISSLDGPVSLRDQRERPSDRSFRQERSRSGGRRDEPHNGRSWNFDGDSHYDHSVEKNRSNLLRIRSRTERLNALHGDRNSNPEHLLEQRNSSNGVRYSRQMNPSEVAAGASPDNSKRLSRNLTNSEMRNQTRLPSQRQSPGGRVQLSRHPIRDISPSRHIERDVPDFVLQHHEGKLLRNLPEDMVQHSMLSHSRPHYERAEGIHLHRERRSLSPQLRRGGPVELPNRRTSDGFNGARELGHCRSPPVMRINRMQSPHERPCFREEGILRRRGSPAYIDRLAGEMVDTGPSREHDFPGPVRGSGRNMRRFNVADHQEMMQGEYFGPPLVHNQIREFGVDDEFVDDRRGEERRGPVRPFRQRRIAGDDESENFRFHVEDGPPRALRLRPDANAGFPGGNGPRDFDMRFRNRLGNPSAGRWSNVTPEQEDSFRHQEEQEWRDNAFNDVRTKRRRF